MEDDSNFADFLRSALVEANRYEVRLASDSFEAGFVASDFHPELILLDIRLADTDGRKVCESIRRLREFEGVRAIAMSGSLLDDEFSRLPRDGFDDYLKKPFSVSTLMEKVAKALAKPSVLETED